MSFWVWITSLSMIFFSSFIHLPANFIGTWFLLLFFLNSWVIVHCVNVLQFVYPFFSWGASRFFFFSSFWLLRIRLQWTWLRKCPCGRMEHSLGTCPRVLLLGPEVDWFPIFLGTAVLISIVAIQVCTPSSNGEVFPLLHIQHELLIVSLIVATLTAIT